MKSVYNFKYLDSVILDRIGRLENKYAYDGYTAGLMTILSCKDIVK